MNSSEAKRTAVLILAATTLTLLSCSTANLRPGQTNRPGDAGPGSHSSISSAGATPAYKLENPELPPLVPYETPYPSFGAPLPTDPHPSVSATEPHAGTHALGSHTSAPPFNASGNAYQFPGNGPGPTMFPGTGLSGSP